MQLKILHYYYFVMFIILVSTTTWMASCALNCKAHNTSRICVLKRHNISEHFIQNHVNMKALVILSFSWSPFLSLISGKKKLWWVSVWPFWGIFLWQKSSQINHANQMTMTTTGQILSWPDYHKTKENVNITLLDLCLFIFYSVHANESNGIGYKQTWYPPDVR